MITRKAIEQVVLDSGLWGPGRSPNYQFLLSPDLYQVTEVRRQELEALACALHDCLAGMGRLAAIACDEHLGSSRTWNMVAKVTRTGVPGLYAGLQVIKPSRVPVVCKVDFLEGVDGRLYIAEIDGHNKHGLGYSTLAARMRRVIAPDHASFPGVVTAIVAELARRNTKSLTLIYADQERFYLPEFQIFQEELRRMGIDMIVAAESELGSEDGKLTVRGQELPGPLFVDLPFMYANESLNQVLAKRYLAGEVDFLIPPKPFLGVKGVLALLRNDEDDTRLESVLHSQIDSSSLALLRQYIPKTYLVSKQRRPEHWHGLMNGTRFVLKESVSSGMKGTVFSDEDKFKAGLAQACGSYHKFVLQEEVQNKPHPFRYFDRDGNVLEGVWYLRVTVHFVMRAVADIIVTARMDKKVHGATDCLQLGSVIV